MPYYDVDSGSLPPEWPCRVCDGLGRDVLRVKSINTDTGDVWIITLGPDGQPLVNSAGMLALTHEILPLPIRFEPIEGDDPQPLIVEA